MNLSFLPLLQTFFLLTGISVTWLIGLIYLQSVRRAVSDPRSGFVSFQPAGQAGYLKWPYFLAIVWLFHTVVACQHFVVSSAVAHWYFARPKARLKAPILSSYWILIRYSFGSVCLASLLVSGLKMTRLMFKRIELLLAYDQPSCGRCASGSRCCHACLWIFEKLLTYLSTNAYAEIALTGKSFRCAAGRAFSLLATNAFKVAVVNTIADLLIFLCKILIVLITLWTGVKLMQDRGAELTFPWSPLIVSGIAAYFVAHCFLSVYEMAIDSLMICYCEDSRRLARQQSEQQQQRGLTVDTSHTLVDLDDR